MPPTRPSSRWAVRLSPRPSVSPWLALPVELVEPIAGAKRLAERHTAVLEQLTLAELIRSGAYDRHVRRRRRAYRQRPDHLVTALRATRVKGMSAGLHALVALPGGMTEEDAVAAANARGLALEGWTLAGSA